MYCKFNMLIEVDVISSVNYILIATVINMKMKQELTSCIILFMVK